jgi:hypothetical protein
MFIYSSFGTENASHPLSAMDRQGAGYPDYSCASSLVAGAFI